MSRPQYLRQNANDADGRLYMLRRRDALGREWHVIASTGAGTTVTAICPTYEAAAAAFRLSTIGCTVSKF